MLLLHICCENWHIWAILKLLADISRYIDTEPPKKSYTNWNTQKAGRYIKYSWPWHARIVQKSVDSAIVKWNIIKCVVVIQQKRVFEQPEKYGISIPSSIHSSMNKHFEIWPQYFSVRKTPQLEKFKSLKTLGTNNKAKSVHVK